MLTQVTLGFEGLLVLRSHLVKLTQESLQDGVVGARADRVRLTTLKGGGDQGTTLDTHRSSLSTKDRCSKKSISSLVGKVRFGKSE